jgi:hypothetical protein
MLADALFTSDMLTCSGEVKPNKLDANCCNVNLSGVPVTHPAKLVQIASKTSITQCLTFIIHFYRTAFFDLATV